MAQVIINGRRVNVPDQVTGRELKSKVKDNQAGRRIVKINGMDIESIEDNKYYCRKDLINKKGKPVKITSIPDRTKG